MKLVDVKVSRYPDKIRGIIIEDGSQWLTMAENVVDYVIDGYIFVNKVHIKQIIEQPQDTITYGILALKCPPALTIPLNSYVSLIEYLKSNNLLIAIGLHIQKSIMVGYVDEVREKSFVLVPIDANLRKMPSIVINYDTIRYISVKSDYLLSISNYLEHCSKRYFIS